MSLWIFHGLLREGGCGRLAAPLLVLAAWSAFRPVSELAAAEPKGAAAETVRLADDSPNTVIVPPATVASMRLTGFVVAPSRAPHPLRLTGQLMLDPNRLVHVHTRFTGEVIQIGDSTRPDNPQLRVGDRVKRGQLLAVLWSKEIGEKKSDLVDALSSLALHETIYRNLKSLDNSGAVAQRNIEEMRRNYESDLIQVERLRRTLRSWRLDESELKEVEAEAKRIHEQASHAPDAAPPKEGAGEGERHAAPDAHWAEIEIRAPLDGVILEKNLTVGDIVETDDDLFKIADLSRLVVAANIYEDDLPTLLGLPAEERTWQVNLTSLGATAPIRGKIESIGNVIDPNQHTAVVQGWIDNTQGHFRVGQFIEAVISIPDGGDEVEIPITALLDDGERKSVFIARKDDMTTLERRSVTVRRRTGRAAFVPNDRKEGVATGERVLTRGVLELNAVLEELSPPKAQ